MAEAGKGPALRWAGRAAVYVLGLFFIALGVALSAKSGLGVSPVGSPANVLYQIGLDRGWPENLSNLGNWTFAVYTVYILAQILMLRRKFRPLQLLQLVVSFLFGYLVNLAGAILSPIPAPGVYWLRMAYLLASIPLVALGVLLYLSAKLLPTPGEGTALAVSETFRTAVSTGKTVLDCSAVTISVVLSLVYFHGLVGVREGTIISALLTGPCMRLFETLIPRLKTK